MYQSIMIRPKNIRVTVASLSHPSAKIKQLFFQVLDDYAGRYNRVIMEDTVEVHICLIDAEASPTFSGSTIWEIDNPNRILVQVRDPLLETDDINGYSYSWLINILCHEFVHVCQLLTNSKGFRIPKLRYDKGNSVDGYFFDPVEVEARALEAYYAVTYGKKVYG